MNDYNITFEQLIFNPEVPENYEHGEPYAYIEGYKDGAKAGAQWQKEQDKELRDAAKKILNYYHPNTYDPGHEYSEALKKAIANYDNQF